METLNPNWYWIEQDGEAYPCLFDGEKWHSKKHSGEHKVLQAIAFSCNPECKCVQNPDGTWTITCS